MASTGTLTSSKYRTVFMSMKYNISFEKQDGRDKFHPHLPPPLLPQPRFKKWPLQISQFCGKPYEAKFPKTFGSLKHIL